MPKRVPTPPPGDDEPRYLTVVHPYAISGTCNMELPKDRQDFARWVACCINKDAFFAIFHKPSSRGMVIIEINRDYPYFERILGEHRWSEFLQNPTREEADRLTQVFYCTYNTGRIVQKHGWKRIDVDEAWFKNWTPRNRHINFPYPATHFCDVPIEDHTNQPLCRPLPGAVKTPPVEIIAAPQPVVGSTAWIQTKATGSSSPPATKSSPLGAWSKGAPHLRTTSLKPNPTANGSGKRASVSPIPHTTATRHPAVGGGPIAVKASNVWQNKGQKPSAAGSWDDSPPISRGSTPLSRAVSPTTSHQAPAAPPGVPLPKSAWEDDTVHPLAMPGRAGSVAQSDPGRAGNASVAGWSSTGPSSASPSTPDSDLGLNSTPTTEGDNPYAVQIHFSESMEEEFHGMEITTRDDADDLRGLDMIAPAWDEPAGDAWETTPGNWDDPVDAEDQWRQTQDPAPKPVLCNAHGIICKKGICAEYASQIRLQKRAEEAAKRQAAIANKGKKNNHPKDRGAAKKNDGNGNQSPAKNITQNNPFRGPGAPVRTNWRGTPRAIVSADSIEKRETTKATSDDGWGNSDSEIEPKGATVVPTVVADSESAASWGMDEGDFDPWAEPGAKAEPSPSQGGGRPRAKKPAATKVSASWADQVEAEVRGGGVNHSFTTVTSKRGPKRGKGSAAGWGTKSAKSSASGWSTGTTGDAKSSTGGWGSVADAEMPW